MTPVSKWTLTDTEKNKLIEILTANLHSLRIQAGISQEELANLIGISRQTYSSIERKKKRMAWNSYLSLVFFFDHNKKTHKMIRILSIFPTEIIIRFNDGLDYSSFDLSALIGDQAIDIIEHLDQQALQTIRSMIMVEYARCTQLPSEAIIKSFSGLNFLQPGISTKNTVVTKAIRAIKRNRKNDEK